MNFPIDFLLTSSTMRVDALIVARLLLGQGCALNSPIPHACMHTAALDRPCIHAYIHVCEC